MLSLFQEGMNNAVVNKGDENLIFAVPSIQYHRLFFDSDRRAIFVDDLQCEGIVLNQGRASNVVGGFLTRSVDDWTKI